MSIEFNAHVTCTNGEKKLAVFALQHQVSDPTLRVFSGDLGFFDFVEGFRVFWT